MDDSCEIKVKNKIDGEGFMNETDALDFRRQVVSMMFNTGQTPLGKNFKIQGKFSRHRSVESDHG